MEMEKMLKSVAGNLKVTFGGYVSCRGIFHITDPDGALLPHVHVSYRVGAKGDWIPCGESKEDAASRAAATTINFIQPFAIYYRIGEPVSWRFSRPGYSTQTITRYAADRAFNEAFNMIVLQKSIIPFCPPIRTVDQERENRVEHAL